MNDFVLAATWMMTRRASATTCFPKGHERTRSSRVRTGPPASQVRAVAQSMVLGQRAPGTVPEVDRYREEDADMRNNGEIPQRALSSPTNECECYVDAQMRRKTGRNWQVGHNLV